MKRENFEKAFENISDKTVTEAVLSRDKKRGRRGVLAKILIPAAILLLLSTVLAVNAASPVDLSFYISASFSGDYTMLSDMVSMPDKVAYRNSGDEVRLELKGVMGDSVSAVIYFDVVVSPGIEIPERWYLDIDYDELCLPWNSMGLGGSQGTLEHTVDADGSNRFKSYVRVTQSDAIMPDSFNMSNQAFYITLNGIGGWKNYPDNPERFTVLEGKWSMALQLNYRDISTAYIFGKDYIVSQPEFVTDEMLVSEAGEPITLNINRISLSPIGITYYFSLPQEDVDEFRLFNSIGDVSGVKLKDGRIIATRHSIFGDIAELNSNGGSTSGRRGDDGRQYMSVNLRFEDVIDIADVESLLISDTEIKLGDAVSVEKAYLPESGETEIAVPDGVGESFETDVTE